MERAAPGFFVRAGLTDDTTAAWMAAADKAPDATLCLLTALSLHDLTDEIPAASDIAVRRGARPPRVDIAPVRWHRFDPQTFDIGREALPLPAGRSIGITSPERTVVDAYRLRHEWGSDLAAGALRRWLRRPGRRPSELLRVASFFPQAAAAIGDALAVLL